MGSLYLIQNEAQKQRRIFGRRIGKVGANRSRGIRMTEKEKKAGEYAAKVGESIMMTILSAIVRMWQCGILHYKHKNYEIGAFASFRSGNGWSKGVIVEKITDTLAVLCIYGQVNALIKRKK